MKIVKKFKVNFNVKQFQQSFGTCKIVVRVLQFFRSSLLYIEVWKRHCWLLAHQKRSCLKLDQITNYLLPDLIIVVWRNNFKSIPGIEEYQRSHSCSSCTIADTKQSNGDSGCTLCTIALFKRSPKNKHQMPSKFFWISWCFSFYSSAMIGVIKTAFDTNLKLPVFQLLMIFSSW